MNIKTSFRGFYFFKTLLVVILMSILSTQSMAANYPLEIIQPQPGIDTKNRFYKAYPGLEYNVILAVLGGEFPFLFALATAPSGMTIDKRGEISWANPVASGTPYNVTATVTDAQSNTRSVSWTITVTTTGFRFIDAVNGKSVTQGGTGSFTNPWKSFRDMYEGDVYASKTANSYAGEFLYWRAGTYTMDAYKENGGTRVPFVSNFKPQVWLAYPGETHVIDMASAHISIYAGGSNTYFDGLDFNVNGNSAHMGITIPSSAYNVTFRKNKLYGITGAVTGGNGACIFITKGPSMGRYYSIQDNEFYNVGSNGYGILGYNASHVLVEANTLHNINQHPIGPKAATQMWFIRSNRLYSNNTDSIGLQYSDTTGTKSGDIEISYNLVESGGGKVTINSNQSPTGLLVYIFRNTFMDMVQQNLTTSSNGIFHWYENVIVNETSYPEKIVTYRIDVPSRFIVSNNLVGSASDNIADQQGYLTQDYSSYIGTRGHELGKRPLAPTGLTVAGQ